VWLPILGVTELLIKVFNALPFMAFMVVRRLGCGIAAGLNNPNKKVIAFTAMAVPQLHAAPDWRRPLRLQYDSGVHNTCYIGRPVANLRIHPHGFKPQPSRRE
jgi:hypothetical protein